MKKSFIPVCLLAFALLFAGCASSASQYRFDAVIKDATIGDVLVEVCNGDDYFRPGGQVRFSAEQLDDIRAEVGDTVRITYTGAVRESNPPKITPVSWHILKKAPAITVEYGYAYDGISIKSDLPAEWDYEILPYSVGAPWPNASNSYGIRFWPEAEPELQVELVYNIGPGGMCGTGVTFTDVTLAGGYTATLATEIRSDGDISVNLLYKEPYEQFKASCYTTAELWEEYEAEIISILSYSQLTTPSDDAANLPADKISMMVFAEYPMKTIDDLFTQSSLAVTAEYTGGYNCIRIFGDRLIGNFTDYVFEITVALRGAPEEKRITVRVEGGSEGGFEELNSSSPSFEAGKEYLLFLYRPGMGGGYNTEGDYYYILGRNQGTFSEEKPGIYVSQDVGATQLEWEYILENANRHPIDEDYFRTEFIENQKLNLETGLITQQEYDDRMQTIDRYAAIVE